MATLSLAAVGCLHWELGIALSADHLLTFVLSGKGSERRVDLNGSETASTESQDQMESGLLLDVVIGKGFAILQLLSSEDESLLIGRDAFLILNLGLNVVNSVGWLDF